MCEMAVRVNANQQIEAHLLARARVCVCDGAGGVVFWDFARVGSVARRASLFWPAAGGGIIHKL